MQQSFNLMGDASYMTQSQKVLWHLENHKTITNMQAFELYNITQLQSCIRDLRKKFAKEGFKRRIDSIKQKGCNKDGRPITWVKYELVQNSDIY